MDQNETHLSVDLRNQIKKLIVKNFKTIDDSILSYILDVFETNKDEFKTTEDVYDSLGAILSDLGEGGKSDDDVNTLCSSFLNLLLRSNESENGTNQSSNDKIQKLSAPIHLSKIVEPVDILETNKKSIFDLRKEDFSYVDQKKIEKVEAKLKQKQEKRDNVSATPATFIYDAAQNASASQAINKKAEAKKDNESGRSFDIFIENFDISFGNRSLIVGADLQLSFGKRYCLIGRNGMGKTTLLKMISSNQLKIPSNIRVLHVEQEVIGDDTLAIQSVLECDTKRESLLAEEKEINEKFNSNELKNDEALTARLNQIYQELEGMEADKAPSRAAKILCGLGFESDHHTRATREFSGGWRMRLALARALFAKPDLLLLDEPTNMLDLKAIIWLENYLQKWEKTLLIVSHDRSFLNEVATDILHLNSQTITPYRGNYENFLKTRTENLKNQQREYEAQLEYRQHIQIFIDRFRYNANRASQVQSKIKQLEKLPELKAIEKEKEVHFKFPEPDLLHGTILKLDEVDFYYTKNKYIFRNVNISATMTSRICVVGENGSGKTTLLKIILGEYEPVSGFRQTHRSLRIGYFAQHHIDGLSLNCNAVELMQNRFPGRTIEEYRGELGRFGVTGDMALQSIISLSGGQKSRVAFAVMSFQNPNFLVLDEPTNHLDMETIEALGEALNLFQGGIILVSHDERLIQLICKELWLARDHKVTSVAGGYEVYRKLIEKELEF